MRFWFFCLSLIFCLQLPLEAQVNIGNDRQAHRTRCKVSKNGPSNPYLDRKRKDRPSAMMAKDDKKYIKRQSREAKKQLRRSKRDISRANRKRMRGN